MTIAVFISGDDSKEYPLYREVTETAPNSQQNTGTSSTHGNDDWDEDDDPVQYFKIVERTEDLIEIVLRRVDDHGNKYVDNLKDAIRQHADSDGQMGCFFGHVLKMIGEAGYNRDRIDECFVFCHWGTGGLGDVVSKFDAEFQSSFSKWTETEAGKNFAQWRVNAISSMRDEIFDVTSHNSGRTLFGITNLPKTPDEVKTLAKRLEQTTEEDNCTYDCEAQQLKTKCGLVSRVPLLFVPCGMIRQARKLTDVLSTCFSGIDLKSANHESRFYPIFVDFQRNHKTQREIFGSSVPEEFIFRFVKDGEQSDTDLTVELVKCLQARIKVWDSDSNLKKGLAFADMRDWMAGSFRRFCALDEEVHGTGDRIDVVALEKFANSDSNETNADFAEAEKGWTKKRSELSTSISEYKNEKSPNHCLWDLWHKVYENEITALEACAEKGDARESATKFLNEVVYIPHGSQVKYFSPVGKLSCLLIDDEATVARDKISAIKVDERLPEGRCLKDIIDIKDVIVDARREDTVIQQAIREFTEIKRNYETYDFVLLDLRLADEAGADPSGYYLISQVKQFFPHLPIIIYSRYDDMGHMSRAFQMGADWFIRKDEIRKLPRHIKSVVSRLNWHKEWEAIIRLGLWREPTIDCEDQVACAKFRSELSEERKYLLYYLLYKSLESLPGINIAISPLGGGFSSSTTFRACKVTTTDEGKRLQNPVIVKMDMAFNTMSEYERYFRFIRPYIANESGRIESKELTLDRNNSVIVYTFAGRQSESYELNSMYDMLRRDIKNRSSCNYKSYEAAFDVIFNEILPRIHVVKPRLEFGVVADNPSDQPSDFPNRAFGEVAVDVISATKERLITSNDFLANWLCRMPLGRKLEEFKFVAQSKVKESSAEGVIHRYEFCRKDNIDGHGVIEALDFEDKCTIVMTGANVDHVVKYRPHTYPCMTLWVDKCANPAIILEEAIPGFVKKAVEKLHDGKEIGQYRASNEFAEVLKKLMNEPLSAGRPSDDFYKMKAPKDKVRGSEFWEGAFLEIDNKKSTAFNALPSLVRAAKELLNGPLAKKIMECPAGIVHGDLNYANIMLETKKRLSGDSVFTTDIPDVKDVWLIDFARTRRDLIAHDFNVLFTSTLGLLFDLDVWKSEETIAHDIYYRSMRQFWGERAKVNDTISYNRFIETIFRPFVVKAVFDKLDAVPDGMEHDNRLVLIFKILRRIRAAALKAGMTEESYAFTTALACMVASRVYIVHEENAPAAAAMIATAFICLAKLRRMEMEAGK